MEVNEQGLGDRKRDREKNTGVGMRARWRKVGAQDIEVVSKF